MPLLALIVLFAAPAMAQDDKARTAFIACIEADTTSGWQRMSMTWNDETSSRWTNDSLRTVLLALADSDQAVRPIGAWPPSTDTAFHNRLRRRDSTDLVALRAIVARFGWPTKHLVGAKGAEAAFLIAQHNAEIQHEALQLMRQLPAGEVSAANLAMLEDRVFVSDGKPQRYGSQLQPTRNGIAELYPIEDVAHLDERRGSVGLPPFDTYLCMMRAGTGAKVKDPRRPDRSDLSRLDQSWLSAVSGSTRAARRAGR
jgi:hypothetical protein